MNRKTGLNLAKLLCLVLTAAALFALTACTKVGGGGSTIPKGTYVAKGIIDQSFTFDGNNVTFSAFGINASGTYTIEDGNIKITYSVLGIEASFERTFSRNGNTLTIGGTDFVKE